MKQSAWIPNASVEEYYQYWLKDIPENCDRGIVGYVRNFSNEDLVIPIELDNDFMQQRNHPHMCLCIDDDDYIAGCSIELTSSFFKEIYTNDYLRSSLWHEVGHYHTNHYFVTEIVNLSSSSKRMEYYNRGKVMEEEQAADLFALYYTSKEEWLEQIRYFIKARDALVWDDNRSMAINEMRDRRKLIQAIESEEQIKKHLCELCRVENFEDI